MFFPKSLSAIVFSVSLCLAQSVQVGGVVKDSLSSQPVSGVKVAWPKYDKTAATDNAGAFSITSTSSAIRERIGKLNASAPNIVHNGSLTLALIHDAKELIQAYSLQGRWVASYEPFKWNSGSAPLAKSSALPGDGDSLFFSKDGYYPKAVALSGATDKWVVLLNPVVLKNGVRPGAWTALTKQYTAFSLFVSPDGKNIDSISVTTTMHDCADLDFTFSVQGPFPIPPSGAVSIGDSIKIAFTESGFSGTFFTKGAYHKYASPPCQESQIIYVGGGYIIQMVPNYNQVFSMGVPLGFVSQGMVLSTVSLHGTVKKAPDRPAYFPGDTVLVTETADSGFGFNGWSGVSKVLSDSQALVVMDRPRSVVADYSPGFYLTLWAEKARIQRFPEKNYYSPGDTVKLVGLPDKYYRTNGWGGDTYKKSGDTAWVIMDTSKTIAYNVVLKPRLLLSAEHGRISSGPLPDGQFYELEKADTVMLVAIPDPGYQFMGWHDVSRESHDTAWVIMNTDHTVTAYFGPDNIRVRIPQSNINESVAFSPDGALVALAGVITISLWERKTGKFYKEIKPSQWNAKSLQFSPDSKKILAGFTPRGGSELWDIETNKMVYAYRSANCCGTSVAFSPTEPLAVTAGDSTAIFWSTETGAEISRITGKSSFYRTAFSQDGTKLAVASYSDSIRIFDVHSGTTLISVGLGYQKVIPAFSFSPDGLFLNALLAEGTLWQINATTGAVVKKGTFPFKDPGSAAISPDGKRISVTIASSFYMWDAETGESVQTAMYREWSHDIEFSQDNTQILTGSYTGGYAEIWDVK